MSKPRGKRSRHQETSLDSEREEVSEATYGKTKLTLTKGPNTPFTQRITHFKYHRRAKLSWNIRVYKGNKDPKDHLGIFSAWLAEQNRYGDAPWREVAAALVSRNGMVLSWGTGYIHLAWT
ncbi:hypothetical protein Tco_1294306 [Tanacetum coccineum]